MERKDILILLLEKSSFIIVLFLLISKIEGFKQIFRKEEYSILDLLGISTIFSALAVVGNYSGIHVLGSLVNTRIMTIVSGGVLFGPVVGITAGIVSGFHRFLMDPSGITAMPCFLSSVIAGFISGFFYKRIKDEDKWLYGIVFGVIAETVSMMFIQLMVRPSNVANDIVDHIYVPLLAGQVGIGFLVSIVQGIRRERDEVSAQQAKLALDIANKTLPYFRSVTEESLHIACGIIRDDIRCDAVSITDTNRVLAYYGVGEERYADKLNSVVSEVTSSVMKSGKIVNIEDFEFDIFKTAMIIPLRDKEEVIGSLKLYYVKRYTMSFANKTMAIGLSSIISTLFEVSKVEKARAARDKAEIKALQTQINPHFLFNALNTITSFIRFDPDRARSLIISLATFMRYNLEVSDSLISFDRELEQVRAYVEIEKARFGDKLEVLYDVESGVDVCIPSLIVQPLVENAIIHGILKSGGCGTVRVYARRDGDCTVIGVENDGVSIESDVIERIYSGCMPDNKIGLYNVHLRLKLIYGKGVVISRLTPGTRIEFVV